MFEEERPKLTPRHEIGQDLAMLSIGELEDRIALLQAEIARIEAVRAAKGEHLSAAAALFR